MISLTEMEKEIVKAIRIESKLPLASDVGYKDLTLLILGAGLSSAYFL